MAKPSPTTRKAFAIASTIGAVIMSNNNGEPKILALQVQINRAMKVFSRKAGRATYFEISNKIGKLWEIVAKEHNNEILDEEVPRFIEYLSMLIPPAHFKAFLGIAPYRTNTEIRPDVNVRIVHSILALDEELNKFFGTKAHALTPPVKKTVKVKKQRDKAEPKTKEVKVSSAKLKKSADRKRKQKLRDMIAAAKARKEAQ